MITAKNIHKYYDQLHVLKGVDLHIEKGEIVSIVGASGAGKTTLLQILGTLDRPSTSVEGKIILTLNNEDILTMNDKSLSEFRNLNLGFIFQFHQLLPEFTALENAILPALIKGLSMTDAKKEGLRLLQMLGLQDRATHKPNQLSGGEQQRIAVCRALINRPKIIFADEPSGNLDSKNAKELHELFFFLRDELKQSFVIVTHNETLADMADRKITIRDGLLA